MKTTRRMLLLFLFVNMFSTYASEGTNPPSVSSRSSTLQVGPTRTYKKPSEAAAVAINGDIIEIDAGVYLGDCCAWPQSNLTLRGVGASRAHLNANGANSGGKGTWVISGNNTTVENIEFSNATVPDQNGAGIRQEGASLTLRNCYFHNNDDGILANAGATSDILIEYCEFDSNGFGDGYSHNMYIGNVRTFTLQHCYSHRSSIGHLVKSRAQTNYILYNRITCESTGTTSYEINLPNGGRSYIIGNLIEQGNNADNPILLSYAEEGATNTVQEIYIVNNTFVNDRSNGGTFVKIAGTPAQSKLTNNIFCGPGTVLSGSGTQTTNLVSNSPGLVNAGAFDYHLASGSAAINAGSDPGSGAGFSLTPIYQYVQPIAREARPVNGVLDIGAYEFGTGAPPPTAPSAPSGLTAVATSSTQINLSWTDTANNETGFKLERKTGAGGTYAQIAAPAANATSYTDTGRSASTQYFYRIRATNAIGDSANSNEANATTPAAAAQAPAAPNTLIAVGASSSRIALTWVDADGLETSFELQRGTDGVAFSTLKTVAANTTSYNDDGLPAATLYYYRVRAINGAGASAFSNVASAVTMSGSSGGGGTTPPGQGPNDDFDGDGIINANDTDKDNDGVSDTDEIAAGTDPYDASSVPPPTAMTVKKFASTINFQFTGKDSYAISGILPSLPANTDVTDKTLTLNVGGAAASFVLNSKGTARNESGSVALRLKPSKRNKTTKKIEFLGGDVAFKAKLAKGTFSDDWTDEGVNVDADAKNQPVILNALLTLDGKKYTATVNALYSGKAGKTGHMKN